jgi:hypothetical protein
MLQGELVQCDRILRCWHREIITEREAWGKLIDCCASILADHPDAVSEVRTFLDTVPLQLVRQMDEHLKGRNEHGGWDWPPGGLVYVAYGPNLPDPSAPLWKEADSQQEAAIRQLVSLLKARLTGVDA